MSLLNFERFFDRAGPAVLLALGLTAAVAVAVVGG
jgi:hypothetical protein